MLHLGFIYDKEVTGGKNMPDEAMEEFFPKGQRPDGKFSIDEAVREAEAVGQLAVHNPLAALYVVEKLPGSPETKRPLYALVQYGMQMRHTRPDVVDQVIGYCGDRCGYGKAA